MASLHSRIQSGQCVIGIYGLGYVGLPLALRFAEVGIRVIGFDIDPAKVASLNSGQSYIERITASEIHRARAAGFTATSDFSITREVDAQIICVPTPLDSHHQPDLSYVTNPVDAILPYFRAGQLMSLESTTWPGTVVRTSASARASRTWWRRSARRSNVPACLTARRAAARFRTPIPFSASCSDRPSSRSRRTSARRLAE